jgi:tRNA-2-methylthio-N6-dimethylallyladenosine synthase
VKWDIRQIAPKYLIRFRDAMLTYLKTGKLISILCPAQSGSPKVLKMMNRDQDMEGFKKTLHSFREANPELNLSTEVIIGFPSETEEDFQETLNLFKEVRFNQISLFAYSDVHGTPASDLPDKIDRATIMDRIDRATQLLKSMGVDTLCDEE